jgi:hypothetical protein
MLTRAALTPRPAFAVLERNGAAEACAARQRDRGRRQPAAPGWLGTRVVGGPLME